MKFYIMGNDNRQQETARILNAENIENNNRLKEIENGYIILPMPVTKDNDFISGTDIKLDSFKDISPNVTIFGGKMPDKLKYYFNLKSIKWIDYSEIESLAVKNAIATAEGTIGILLSERQKTLYGSNCLVVGYGRIGKVLCNLLKAFGGKVFATSRNPSELEWCKINGLNAISTYDIEKITNNMDIIINTAPFLIFTPAILNTISKDALLIDLASKPGGGEFGYFKREVNIFGI